MTASPTYAELQAELASLRATVQNAEIVMAALRERDALVRQAARAFVGVATFPMWADGDCGLCEGWNGAHTALCAYATARAALVALVEGGNHVS